MIGVNPGVRYQLIDSCLITIHLASMCILLNSGLPGKPFLTFFGRQEPFFLSSCVKHFLAFFSGAFKIVPKWPSQSVYLQKFPEAGPLDPTCDMESPLHPAHPPLNDLSHRFVPSCPIEKFSSKRPKNTNLWLKRWLHITNPDHKEYLRVYRHTSMP